MDSRVLCSLSMGSHEAIAYKIRMTILVKENHPMNEIRMTRQVLCGAGTKG